MILKTAILIILIVFSSLNANANEDESIFNNPNIMELYKNDLFIFSECPPDLVKMLGIPSKECYVNFLIAKSTCARYLIGKRKELLSKTELDYNSRHFPICQIYTLLGCKYEKSIFDKLISEIESNNKKTDVEIPKYLEQEIIDYMIKACPKERWDTTANK